MSIRPTHVVAGSTDLERTLRFLALFGFSVVARHAVPREAAAALYGLDEATEEVCLVAPVRPRVDTAGADAPRGRDRRAVRPRSPRSRSLRPRSSRDRADRSRGGRDAGDDRRYVMGPLQVGEVKVVGPDHLALVVIAVNRRRPSLLDADLARQHSEVHAAVWAADGLDEALRFWRDEAGMQVVLDATVREPAIAAFMHLPRPDTPLRLVVMAGVDGGAPRFELITFPEDPDAVVPSWPLRGGLHALGIDTDDLDATRAALPSVAWRDVAGPWPTGGARSLAPRPVACGLTCTRRRRGRSRRGHRAGRAGRGELP